MKKRKILIFSVIFGFVFIFCLVSAFALETTQVSSKEEAQLLALEKESGKVAPAATVEKSETKSCLKEFGILSGYAAGPLNDPQPEYQIVPMIFRFGFDLNPFINKFGLDTKGILEFELEPFINTIISPNNNVEVGSNFLVKYAMPLTKKVYPYFEGGLGMLYMSQHTDEQGSQYNFLPQAGAGIMYFLRDNLALSLGYRYRHLSNNSFAEPNGGIDVNMALVGLSIIY